MKKKETITRPLEEVKEQIARKLAQEKYRKDFEAEKKKKWEGLLAKGRSIEPELKRLKIELKETGTFALDQGYIPKIGESDPILDAVFELSKKNPLPKKLLYHRNAHYFVKLKKLTPPKKVKSAKNYETVERSMSSGIQNELLTKWINALQKNSTIKRALQFEDQGTPPPTLPFSAQSFELMAKVNNFHSPFGCLTRKSSLAKQPT